MATLPQASSPKSELEFLRDFVSFRASGKPFEEPATGAPD